LKFSYNWLRELVDKLDTPADELGRLITMKTAECEGVETVGSHLADVCAARIQSVEPLGKGNNKKAVIDTGRYGVKTVVCGAPNCRVGMMSVYVPLGTRLNDREIHAITIDGVTSDGMLASGAELGINRDAAGILELEAKLGEPIPGCTPDSTIEIDNKSLTHRPDLWGHHGLAREVAVIVGGRLRDPVELDRIPETAPPVGVSIEDLELCPRYSALALENVTVQASPLWLQYRLQAMGLNPINNVVDVTNCVMAELAQPMHAFDWDLLRGPAIFVRTARAGERVVALNEQEYSLDTRDLVIADERGPIAIAGVIGGLDTSINERTTRIVLESANFQASCIRKTSARQKLRTDASMRFEKSQDPINTVRGLARAVELLEQVSPGIRLIGGLADQKKQIQAPAPILLPIDWLMRKLGRKVKTAEVREILEQLEFGVSKESPRVLSVSVPSWRATRDISIKDDLVEEVGRMIGYGSITPQAPAVVSTPPPRNEERLFHRSVRSALVEQGFTEVHNYSFMSEEQARAFGFDPADHVALANPISSDQSLMRRSLLPEIWQNIEENSKHFDSFRLFEIGREIHKQLSGLPKEIPHLMAAVYARDDGQAGLMELKRVAEHLMAGCEVCPVAARPYEHPVRAAELLWRGATMGRLFELHPSMVSGRAAILDVDLELLQNLQTQEKRYEPIRRFPSSAFDLSVVAGLRDLVGDMRKQLVTFAGGDLESIEFLRQYTGPPLPEEKKSLSFRLTIAATDHTLSSDEVAIIRTRIIDGMRRLGCELRL
jgi:phenylalanyl-tRNA synthetase beta chain